MSCEQFRLLAKMILEKPSLADDARFANNAARVENRKALVHIITEVLKKHGRDYWIQRFTGLG